MRMLIVAVVLLAGCSGDGPAPDGVVELIYASPYGPNHPFSLADRDWIEFVESESGGQLRIRPIWSGALLSSDQSMVEIRHGVADIGLITPIYAKGGAHLLRAQTGFYSGAGTMEQQVALYRCLAEGDAQFARELAGLKVLAVQGGPLLGLVTRNRRVTELADIEDLRIRAPAELLPVLQDLGVDPVSMPMSDVYSALAKGIIDGVVAPLDTLRSLHLAEVADSYANLEVPRGAYPARAMGMRRWNELPGAIRAILERGTPVWEQALARRMRTGVETGAAFGREQGMTFTTISADEQERFDRIYRQHAEQEARGLQRYGIDGPSVYQKAVASMTGNGQVDCRRGQ